MPQQSVTSHALADLQVVRAATLKKAPGGGSWQFANLVGILAEISEEMPSGAVSFAAGIISEAQGKGEPAAWVAVTQSIFFPPDFSQRGIDLSALAVIRAGGETDSLAATEWLVRSGAMGLVVVDTNGSWSVSDGSLGRIQKLAERNQCAVLFLSRKRLADPSLGSRISVRGCITRTGSGRFGIAIHTIKDKRANASSRLSRQYHGPTGLY
jgi:recombination protein RecA